MTIYFKWGNYGFHLWLNVYDFQMDATHTWGYRIWWRKLEARIEEEWIWTKDYDGRQRFEWRLKKNGKKFDGFLLQGPLIRFEKT